MTGEPWRVAEVASTVSAADTIGGDTQHFEHQVRGRDAGDTCRVEARRHFTDISADEILAAK